MKPITLTPLLTVALGACAGPLNNEHGIGNAGRPFGRSIYTPATLVEGIPPPPAERFEPTTDQDHSPVYGVAGPVDSQDAQPSLLSLDRSNWGSVPLDVPNDFSAHQPIFTKNYLNKESDPRAQGRFPDERTALGMGTDRHNNEQALESVAGPFVAAFDVLLFVPRAVMEMRPRQPTRTGGEPYARSPRDVVIVNPAAEPAGGATRIQTLPPPPPSGIPTNPNDDPGAAPIPVRSRSTSRAPRPIQPPADDLRPGGGMPATDVPATPGKP